MLAQHDEPEGRRESLPHATSPHKESGINARKEMDAPGCYKFLDSGAPSSTNLSQLATLGRVLGPAHRTDRIVPPEHFCCQHELCWAVTADRFGLANLNCL